MSASATDGSGGGLDPRERFDGSWLSLREPVDHRSRAEELVDLLVREWSARGWSRIVDLGCGTGSNLRYLAPRLPGAQEWRLVDHDPELLDAVHGPPEAGSPVRILGDLDREGLEAVREAELVTGAALLDLVSRPWLERLVGACADHGRGALFTTIYDGTWAWKRAPGDADPDDVLVRSLVNAHQGGDKGLGPALGPRAAFVARALFESAGYRTWLVPGPWVLRSEDAELVGQLVRGWVEAASEQSAEQEERIRLWGARCQQLVDGGKFELVVGHLDLLALPPYGSADV